MRIIARLAGDHHAVIGRSLANKTLDTREPALINLPIPLPSIPVLTPILSPLIAGNNQNSGSGTTTTTTTSAAPPAQTSSSSGSSGGSTGGSTGGSSGGDTGGSSGGNTGGTTGGSTGTDTTGTGTGSTGGSTTTSPSTGDTEPGSSSGDGSATGGTTTGSGTSTSGNSGSGSSGGAPSTNSNSTDSSPSSNYNSSGDGATAPGFNVPGIANAGNIPSSSQTSSDGSNAGSGSPTATGRPTTSTNGAGGGNDTVVGDDANTLGTSSKGGLSGGAIAGIIICVLLLLICLVVFILRRRSRARRDEQANQWWFTRKRTSQTYGDRNSQEILAGAPSARSSFATTVDHSRDSPCFGSFVIPPLPPMAEVGRDKATAPIFVFESSHFNSNSNSNSNARFSVGSAHSENSQYLVVHHRDSLNPEIGTPMSVRPFSPSESFAFPKPPEAASARNSVHSRPATASSTHSASGTFSAKDIDDAIPPTPALPQLHLLQSPISPSSNPFADNNPFDDPAAAAVNNGSVGEFAETETIRRPFHPTLPDELKVRPDDIVHIIRSFDDGWALVEKLDVKGKGKEGAEPERGLIPVDCLREPGLDLPAFCAAKRMSSYTGPVADGGVHAL